MDPNHWGAARNLFPTLLVIAAASATVSAAPTLFIQPVSSSGTHTIIGNQIQIPVGGVEVAFDIRAYGWGPVSGNQNIGAVQATMDSASYLGANATPPNPSVNLYPKGLAPWIPGDDPSMGAFLIAEVCSSSNRRCGNGLPPCSQDEGFCIPNPDFIFSCCGSTNILGTNTLNYEFGAVSTNLTLGPTDAGPAGLHLGRLILEVPSDAFGSYTIKLNPLNDFSFMIRVNGFLVPTLELPAVISIAGNCTADADCNNGRFCDGVEVCNTTTGDCEPGAPPCVIPTPHCNEFDAACEGCAGDSGCPDDGLFCNGVESCDLVNYACIRSGDPCGVAQSCDEAGDSCMDLGIPTMQMVVKDADAPFSGSTCIAVPNADSVTVFGAGCDIEFVIRASGWGSAPGNPLLGVIEANIIGSSFLGINAQPPNPGIDLVPKGYQLPDPFGGNRQLGGFQVTHICQQSGRNCTPGQPQCAIDEGVCISNPDFLFGCCPFINVVSTASLQFYGFGALYNGPPWGILDNGLDPSFGNLVLQIPQGATGTYTLQFGKWPQDLHYSFMSDSNGVEIMLTSMLYVPMSITITNAPVPALQQDNYTKNRYISFSPPGGAYLGAFRVEKTTLPTGGCWVGTPDANGNARCGTAPVFRLWDEPVVSVGDCEIVPAATYTIRATADGAVFTDPLMVKTTPTPSSNNKLWGDVAGAISFGEWSQPDGFANVQDILAVLAYITSAAVKPTFQQANLQSISSVDPCLNNFVNTADVLILVKAVAGDAYPFTTDPANCPVCP